MQIWGSQVNLKMTGRSHQLKFHAGEARTGHCQPVSQVILSEQPSHESVVIQNSCSRGQMSLGVCPVTQVKSFLSQLPLLLNEVFKSQKMENGNNQYLMVSYPCTHINITCKYTYVSSIHIRKEVYVYYLYVCIYLYISFISVCVCVCLYT